MCHELFTIHPNKWSRLISFKPEDEGVVQLLHPELYNLYNPRYYEDIVSLFSEDYQQNVVIPEKRTEAYAGAESLLLPNITVFPPYWEGRGCQRICPNSMGHIHAPASKRYIELYFVVSGTAGVLTQRRAEPFVEMTVASPNDFVPTEADSNMTLFNLNPEEPLVLLDISGAAHASNKDLQRNIGPIVLISWKQRAFSVRLNPQYIGRKDGFGVDGIAEDDVEVTIPVASLSKIAEELTSESAQKQWRRLGIHTRRANNEDVAAQLQIPLKAFKPQYLRKDSASPLYAAIRA